MDYSPTESRIDAEWVALSAFREILKVSTKGNASMSTYAEALEFGEELYPALLGKESSLLRRSIESDITREYRQRAQLKRLSGTNVTASDLLAIDIEELDQLLFLAKRERVKDRVDQLKKRLKSLRGAQAELSPERHTETQLIMRDAAAFPAGLPKMDSGKAYKAFQLPDGALLRVDVFHPDKPEHISGADVVYERHEGEFATLVFVQYKVWEEQTLPLNDSRMKAQLARLKALVCDGGLCTVNESTNPYRFPHCAAFLRPTDRLQHASQKLMSSGEHLPICRIDECKVVNRFKVPVLTIEKIRRTSVSGHAFEYLFTYDRLGSRSVTRQDLNVLYQKLHLSSDPSHMLIHAQEVGLDSDNDE